MKRKPATRKQAKRAKPSPRNKSAVQDSDVNKQPEFAARVERALLRAGENARRTARMYGTPLYVLEKGRIVAKRP